MTGSKNRDVGRASWFVFLVAIAWLAASGGAGAITTERAAPPSAWWKAAEIALARGDCVRAVGLLEKLLDEGESGAMTPLGDIHERAHENGPCAELGLPPAVEFYREMIARGFPMAKARIGYFYLEGLGVPQDRARARGLFKEVVLEVAAHAFPEAWRDIVGYAMGRHGIPADLEAELDWAEQVEFGSPQLQYATALRLLAGDGLPQNEDAAEDWLQRAAHAGLPEAWFTWGMWELKRACNDHDRDQAFNSISRAAELNYPPALKEMGLRLAEGHGVERYDFGAMILLLQAHWAGQDVAATLQEVGDRLDRYEKAVTVDLAMRGKYYPPFSVTPNLRQRQPKLSRSCIKSRLSFRRSWRR